MKHKIKDKQTKKYNKNIIPLIVLRVLINIGVFTFIGFLLVFITKEFTPYLLEYPLIMRLGWIIGVVGILIKTKSINWSCIND